jgi:hypothetical protein
MFEIATEGRKLPGRYFVYGVEKIGKTSLCAYMPSPVFLQARGETGLEALIDAGQLPPVAHIPGELKSWQEVLEAVEWIRTTKHEHKTLVIDGIDSVLRLCFEHVKRTQFDDDEKKFMAYWKGYECTPNIWKELLSALDVLRAERKMAIVMVCHAKVSKKKNPAGEDWTCYTPNLHEYVWAITAAWLDCILFMDFYKAVGDDGKASGDDSVRTIYCQHDATYDAGNRFGLKEDIDCGDSPQEAWKNLSAAIKAARTRKEN